MYVSPLSSGSGARFGNATLFRNATVRLRSYDELTVRNQASQQYNNRPSTYSLLQLHRLREALSALKPGRVRAGSSTIAAQAAGAISSFPLNFGTGAPAQIRSTEEINTAPTSFQHNGPAWIGSTATAPWSGLGSTADASVGGTYDGSDGQGVLTFKVVSAGTHGEDDLRIRVLGEGGQFVENINIGKNDPLNQVYQLSNGLEITLGEGELVRNDFFEVDVSLLSTSYTPSEPDWTGSTALPSIGGLYDGSNGSGELTFRVTRGGVHGEDDLRIKVYDPSGASIGTIDIKKNDPIDKVYALSNGLTFSLGEGELVKNETFKVAVDATDPGNYTSAPEWLFSSSTATLTGTYDGSLGSGTLTFRALSTGVHGEDDLRVRVYRPDGSTLQTIDISRDDPIDTGYELSNGLTVSFSAGNLIRNETFTVDLSAVGSFSTDPNPVQSTAQPFLQGIYDGSLGTDVLEFKVVQSGIHGMDDLAFEARTSDGTLVDLINISSNDDPDQTYEMSNGLVLSLGAGSLALNETFTVSVNHLVPTSVDPDLSFDGTGVNDPRLEDQFTITDGSFQINGNTIAVFANDSINSVLARINNAGIDVTASFDALTETIVMTHNLSGEEHDIVLSDDTSGFLAATKLQGAVSSRSIGDETTILSDLEIMSDVSSGLLSINGTSVMIDIDSDSLNDVLSRIETMVPGVTVDFDSETDRVSIAATDMSDLEISSGVTEFFAAIGISEGVYKPTEARKAATGNEGFSYQTRRDTVRAVNQFAKRFNAVFEDTYLARNDSYIDEIRNELKQAVAEAFAAGRKNDQSGDSIVIDFQNENDGPFQFSEIRHQFERGLKTGEGAAQFNELFFSNEENEGLVDRVLDLVKAAERELSLELGQAGIFVDFRA